MKKSIGIVLLILLIVPMSFSNEFVVSKKDKAKKEIAGRVKEDIAELLESMLRQLGTNIQQSVSVQNYIFDTIKDVCGQGQKSTAQLKELRDKLEKYLKKIEEQQADLEAFMLIFK